MATLIVSLGLPTWQQHQRDAETAAFLARVATPPDVPDISGPATVPTTLMSATTVATRPPSVIAPAHAIDRTILAAPSSPPPPALSNYGTVAPSASPMPRMPSPTHLSIPAIKVDADIVEVGISPIEIDGQQAAIWDVPVYAVGHHFSSANPGEGENVVLSGHDDWQGEVFKNLSKLKKGDEVRVRAGDTERRYRVNVLLLLPETGQPLEKRQANARFIDTTGDERVTLVTCWPYGRDDQRLIVIARPAT